MAAIPSPIQQIHDPLFDEKGIELWVKRDDLIHPTIMGNKWRKLKYNIAFAKQKKQKGIVTMGGAYSNHIVATAAACKEHGLDAIGIIRGDELNETSNASLRFASDQGMKLKFVSRSAYRYMRENLNLIQTDYPDYLLLPEGGTNALAIKGCAEIISELEMPFDYVTTPVGTGGTMAGMLAGMNGHGVLIGFAALKGSFVEADFAKLIDNQRINHRNYQINSDYHFGGYAKVPDDIIVFINRIKEKFDLQFDPIYNGKMYFGVTELIARGYFQRNTKILVLHTGGLQGVAAFNQHRKTVLLH